MAVLLRMNWKPRINWLFQRDFERMVIDLLQACVLALPCAYSSAPLISAM